MDETTSGGVCEALSAHWIYYHAQGGSMWKWLAPGGAISLSQLQYSVMQLQMLGVLGVNQDAITEQWLRGKGIHRRQSNFVLNPTRQFGATNISFQGGSAGAFQSGTSGFLNRNDLTRAIMQDTTGGAGVYKKLGLAGKAGAHAMALWVAQDVVFFDPNYGEFWFAKRSDFFNWFTKSFWHGSLYSMGLSGTYELYPYAKGI